MAVKQYLTVFGATMKYSFPPMSMSHCRARHPLPRGAPERSARFPRGRQQCPVARYVDAFTLPKIGWLYLLVYGVSLSVMLWIKAWGVLFCVVLARFAFNILSKLYIGIKGITRLKGRQGKTGHTTVAKIAIVVLAISFAYLVYRSFSGSANWPAMLNPPISIIILVGFIKDAGQIE